MQDTKPLPKYRRINRKKTAAKKKDTKLLPKCHRNRKETLAKENDTKLTKALPKQEKNCCKEK